MYNNNNNNNNKVRYFHEQNHNSQFLSLQAFCRQALNKQKIIIASVRLHISDEAIEVAVGLRLGAATCQPHTCLRAYMVCPARRGRRVKYDTPK